MKQRVKVTNMEDRNGMKNSWKVILGVVLSIQLANAGGGTQALQVLAGSADGRAALQLLAEGKVAGGKTLATSIGVRPEDVMSLRSDPAAAKRFIKSIETAAATDAGLASFLRAVESRTQAAVNAGDAKGVELTVTDLAKNELGKVTFGAASNTAAVSPSAAASLSRRMVRNTAPEVTVTPSNVLSTDPAKLLASLEPRVVAGDVSASALQALVAADAEVRAATGQGLIGRGLGKECGREDFPALALNNAVEALIAARGARNSVEALDLSGTRLGQLVEVETKPGKERICQAFEAPCEIAGPVFAKACAAL